MARKSLEPHHFPAVPGGPVQGRLLRKCWNSFHPDDMGQPAGAVFDAARQICRICRHLHKDHPAINKGLEFQVLTAACRWMKRESFFGVGLYDEGFINGYKDVDLCLKLPLKGCRLPYNPRAVVYHFESQTKGRFDREGFNARL